MRYRDDFVAILIVAIFGAIVFITVPGSFSRTVVRIDKIPTAIMNNFS